MRKVKGAQTPRHIHPSHYLVPLHWFYSPEEKLLNVIFESKQLDKQDQRLRHSGKNWLSKNDHKGTFWSLGCETPQLKSLKN